MSAVELVPARLSHVGPIATRMRAADVLECEAFGFTPKAALRRGLIGSSLCWTALVDGRPEAMLGLEIRSAIEGLGTPWMLATDAAYAHARHLICMGPGILSAMRDSSPYLSQLVHADNARALRMIRHWGFQVEDDVTMIGGQPFLRFEMR